MVSGPPVTSCENSLSVVDPPGQVMQFLTDHLLFFLFLSICRGFRQVLRRCFLAWGQLPRIQHEERVKEGRRERLACKVVEVLPDFRLQLAETLQNIWDTDISAASVPITE